VDGVNRLVLSVPSLLILTSSLKQGSLFNFRYLLPALPALPISTSQVLFNMTSFTISQLGLIFYFAHPKLFSSTKTFFSLFSNSTPLLTQFLIRSVSCSLSLPCSRSNCACISAASPSSSICQAGPLPPASSPPSAPVSPRAS
jgi:hypothetical protein